MPKYLFSQAAGLKVTDAAGATLADPDNTPIVVPPSVIKAAASKLGMVEASAAPAPAVGSDAWAARLDADARASFDRLVAAGASSLDAGLIASAPAENRAAFEKMALDGLAARTAKVLAEADAFETKISADADAWIAGDDIKARLLPAAREQAKGLYLAAARFDHANPPAEGTTGHLDAFTAFVGLARPHGLTERIATGDPLPAGAKILDPDAHGEDGPISEERRKELLGHTESGRAALRAEANGRAKVSR